MTDHPCTPDLDTLMEREKADGAILVLLHHAAPADTIVHLPEDPTALRVAAITLSGLVRDLLIRAEQIETRGSLS